MSCHRASISQVSGGGLNLETGDVGLRMLDAPSKTESTGCRDEYLIDFYAPHNSLLLKLIDQSKFIKLNATTCKRQPMPQSAAFMSAVDYACVASWVTEVTKTKTPTPLPDTQTFSPNNNATALTKAKYILHGGAATDAEFTAVTEAQGDIDPEALSNIIASWESTPEYQLKIKDFLALSLQQMPFGDSQYRDQLNNITKAELTKIDAVSLRKNFEESFVRTASEIVTNNEDFRKVITTRKWEMTTAMMAALVYLDKPNQPETRNYYLDATPGNFFAEMAYFQPSDYTDWRQVTIVQSEIPATWENTADFTAQLRSIANDGQLLLRYPRVGFFSSPVFLNRWATNNDNQFRVTTSQTLIVAL